MVDLSAKSKEEIFREKKEAELREAKRKENEARRRSETHIKCFIGGAFKKYFPDAFLFDEGEWCRIAEAAIGTEAFKNTVEAIRQEAAIKQKQKPQTDSKQEHKPPKQENQPAKPKEPRTEKAPEMAKSENGSQEQQRHEDGNNG